MAFSLDTNGDNGGTTTASISIAADNWILVVSGFSTNASAVFSEGPAWNGSALSKFASNYGGGASGPAGADHFYIVGASPITGTLTLQPSPNWDNGGSVSWIVFGGVDQTLGIQSSDVLTSNATTSNVSMNNTLAGTAELLFVSLGGIETNGGDGNFVFDTDQTLIFSTSAGTYFSMGATYHAGSASHVETMTSTYGLNGGGEAYFNSFILYPSAGGGGYAFILGYSKKFAEGWDRMSGGLLVPPNYDRWKAPKHIPVPELVTI